MLSPTLSYPVVGAIVQDRSASEDNETTKSSNGSKISVWCRQGLVSAENGVKATGNAIENFVQGFFRAMTELTADTNALAAFFRKLDKHVLVMMEQLGKTPEFFNKFRENIRATVGFIDFVQVAVDVDYFANAKFKEDNKLSIAGRISIAVADVGGALLWLQEMSFFNLSKAATSIGNIQVFSFVPKVVSVIPVIRDVAALQRVAATVGQVRIFSAITKISLGFVAERALTLGYVFFAAESFQRLMSPGNHFQKTHAALDLASYISELALDALLTVGVTNIIGLGVMGTVCLSLALSSFLYKVFNEKEIKQTPQLQAQNVAA